jgi:hypothetical protein
VRTGRNEALAALLTEAGWSYDMLARKINALGTRQGLRLIYDKSSVSHWVAGKKPRSPTPTLIANVLSAQLGRDIGVVDLGLGNAADAELAERASTYQAGLTSELDVAEMLGRADVNRRQFLYLLPYATAVAAGPQRDWLLHVLDLQKERPRGAVDARHIEGMAEMERVFSEIDNRFGGAHARSALASYITNETLPLLRRDASDSIRVELLMGASSLFLTLGWMTYDSGYTGLVQRYLVRALYLAREAGPRGLSVGSEILSASSHVATFSDDPREGLAIARAAVHTAERTDSTVAAIRANLMEARARASLNDGAGAARALTAAEVALDRQRPDGQDSDWLTSRFDDTYVANQSAFCFYKLLDPRNVEQCVEMSLSSVEGRQNALNRWYLAITHLRYGDLDAAEEFGRSAVASTRSVRSALVRRIVDDYSSVARQRARSKNFADVFQAIDRLN